MHSAVLWLSFRYKVLGHLILSLYPKQTSDLNSAVFPARNGHKLRSLPKLASGISVTKANASRYIPSGSAIEERQGFYIFGMQH
jgi:hypothetical protein